MIFYWIVIIIAVANCFIYKKRPSLYISVFCILYMCLLSGFRTQEIGTDSTMYAYRFEYSGALNVSEFVYVEIIRTLRLVSKSYSIFFLLMSVLFYAPVLFVSLKKCPKSLPFVVLLLCIANNGYFMESFNAIRQLAATGLLLLGYYFIDKHKKWIAIALFIMAVGIHTTSLFFFPFILVSFKDVKFKWMCSLLLFANLFAFVFSNYYSFDARIVLQYINLFDAERYSSYVESDTYGHGYNLIGIVKNLLLPSIVCLLVNKTLPNNLYGRLYFWGLVSLGLTIPFLNIAIRITQGLVVAELIAVPMAVEKMRGDSRQIVFGYMALLSLYFFYMMSTFFVMPENLGVYKTVLFDTY